MSTATNFASAVCGYKGCTYYRCSRCKAWHTGNYGVIYEAKLPSESWSGRIGLCSNCAKEILPNIRELITSEIPIREKDRVKSVEIDKNFNAWLDGLEKGDSNE